MTKQSEILDTMEKILVSTAKSYVEEAAKFKVTDEEARNLVGKVGTRIMFGSEVYDEAMLGEKTKS